VGAGTLISAILKSLVAVLCQKNRKWVKFYLLILSRDKPETEMICIN